MGFLKRGSFFFGEGGGKDLSSDVLKFYNYFIIVITILRSL